MANPRSWTLRADTPRGSWGTVENHSSPNSRLCVCVWGGACIISSDKNSQPSVGQSKQVPGECRSASNCWVGRGAGCLEVSKEGSWWGREVGWREFPQDSGLVNARNISILQQTAETILTQAS